MFTAVWSLAIGAPSFEEFTAQFGKAYPASEIAERRVLYAAKLASIGAHNAGPHGAERGYTAGVNAMADWTPSEYAARFGLDKAALMGGRAQRVGIASAAAATAPATAPIPSAWDWAKKGALTKPRDQGTCGSCWAFAAAEAIESQLFLSPYGKLAELSPQAMVDCVPNPRQCGGTGGCEGNTFDAGFEWARNSSGGFGGAVLQSDYAYTGKDGTCTASKVKTFANVGGWVDVPSNNYTALQRAVMVTPVSCSTAAF